MAQKWSSWVNKNVNRPVFVKAQIVPFKKRSEKNLLSKSASFSSAARGPLRAAGRQTPSRARPPRRPGRLSGPDRQRKRLPQNEHEDSLLQATAPLELETACTVASALRPKPNWHDGLIGLVQHSFSLQQ